MSKHKSRLLDENENLINRTQNSDNYESELQKRSSLYANESNSEKRKHTLKVAIFVGMTLLAFVMLLIVMLAIAKGPNYLEDQQENNMFKFISREVSLRKVVVQLESKYKGKTGTYSNLKAEK